MSDPKPFASLGASLLARKGAARPAMRPQLQPIPGANGNLDAAEDDLGWNDMGDHNSHFPTPLHLTPAPANPEQDAEAAAADRAEQAKLDAAPVAEEEDPVIKPAVVQQREDIAAKIAEPVPARAIARAQRPARRSALDRGAKAAFTLRLDAERHLKLRLACTARNRSAQQLVTEALDAMLQRMPELDSLAAQIKRD